MATSGNNWRAANSITTLRNQLNAAYPNRNKASDGILGDAAHAATVSDHNPNSEGVVTAFDITHDPSNGLDIAALAESLANSRDGRIKYLIRNRQIMVPSDYGWVWTPYSGADPHTSHLHVSVWGNYDDTTNWTIGETIVDKQATYEWLANASQFLLGRPTPVTRDWYNNSVEKNMTESQVYASWANSDEARNFRFKAWDYDRAKTQAANDASNKLVGYERTIAEQAETIKRLSQHAQTPPSLDIIPSTQPPAEMTPEAATPAEPIDTKQVNWLVRILINLFGKKS